MGDVLRTTPLLTALKNRYPGCHITWIVDSSCAEVLENNPLIDRLLTYSEESLIFLNTQKFDMAVNLDKDKEALGSIALVHADKKMGFGKTEEGALCALDASSDYAYRLGLDDDLKFKKNQKTYQEISFEQAGLEFRGEEYIFPENPKSDTFAKNLLAGLGVSLAPKKSVVIGLNTGAGNRFAGKRLPVATHAELAEKFYKRLGAAVLLLGGKDEIERNHRIQRLSKVPVVNTGSHSLHHFASIVKLCDVVISGDTTAMHIAIAVRTPVVAYFASTCAAEIEFYGRGRKIISDIACAPCYLKDCPIDEKCMKDMGSEALFSAVKTLIEQVSVS